MTPTPGAGADAKARAPAAPTPRVLRGILFMLMSATLFPIMNGFVKMLSADYASEQIIWARNAMHFIFVLVLFAPRRGWGIFRANQMGAQIARSVLLMVSTVCYFIAVKFIPLGKAATIQFIAPFIVSLMAWRFLGEKLVPARIAAVCVGFMGVILVIRPGTDVFTWAALLPVASSAFYAAYQVYTRFVADKDSPETSVVYSALVGTVVMTVFLPFVWKTPLAAFDILLMTSLGVLGGLGHYCVARAMQHAEASVISPFNYWQLVGSSVFGAWIFDEILDAYTWAGAAVIVAAGLFMWRLETRRAPTAAHANGDDATTARAPTRPG